MKEKIFKWLFKDKITEYNNLKENYFRSLEQIKEYRKDKLTKPTMADLMRDSMGLPTFTFTGVEKDGYPPHYLEGLSAEDRQSFQAELNSVYMKPQFQAVMDYWVNTFGNHAIRKGKDEIELGRYSINGIAMIRKSLESAHTETLEASKPTEDFDKHAVLPEGDD